MASEFRVWDYLGVGLGLGFIRHRLNKDDLHNQWLHVVRNSNDPLIALAGWHG